MNLISWLNLIKERGCMCQKKKRERNSTCFDVVQEEFEDSKGVIRIRIQFTQKIY